jgi:DNA-binding transcriptional MocR family regulator
MIKEISPQAIEAAFQVDENDPFGLLSLRSNIQGLLVERGIWADLSSICLFNGSQQAIWLIANQLLNPGDLVAIPETCYLPIKEIFQSKGAQIITVRQDGNGIDINHLEQITKKSNLALLFAMPNGHYPTGESWTYDKKVAVLQLAQKYSFIILEDDFYGELYYQPTPPISLYSLASDLQEDVCVFYTSSYHMLIHSNIRLGYLLIPKQNIETFVHAKYLLDKTASILSQYLLLFLWQEINLSHYLQKLRSTLKLSRHAMLQSLKRWLPREYRFSCPEVGVSTWVYPSIPFDGFQFFERCLAEHVFVMPGEAFAIESPVPGFQVNFGKMPPDMLDEAIRRIGKVLNRLPKKNT